MRRIYVRLGRGPGATRRARRVVARSLGQWGRSALVDDAELVVSELVANALLHTDSEPGLEVTELVDGVRVAVHDEGAHDMPELSALAPPEEAMTGRGLRLVASFARRMGVDDTGHGKSVWCELPGGHPAGDSDTRVAPALEHWHAEEGEAHPHDHAPTVLVDIPDVPAELLLVTKVQIDNLARELSLAASGGTDRPQTAPGDLLRRLTGWLRQPRATGSAQALQALARGEERFHFRMEAPAALIDGLEDYLRAVDDADAHSRAMRLLVPASPPEQVVFRRWFYGEALRQARARLEGRDPGPGQSFESRLLDELRATAEARLAAERSARLQQVTSVLAGASSAAAVADAVLHEGVTALGASGGGLLLAAQERLTLAGAVGYRSEVADRLDAEHSSAGLPAAVALRTGRPVWVESREDRDRRFPSLALIEPDTVSLCAVPLVVDTRALGAIRFSFTEPRLFGPAEREFITALAAQAAQTLDRVRLYDVERRSLVAAQRVADRLVRLQRLIDSTASAVGPKQVADLLVSAASDSFGATYATVFLLDPSGEWLEIVAVSPSLGHGLSGFREHLVDDPLPASDAVRERDTIVVATLAERDSRYPLLRGRPPHEEHALVCIPLAVGARVLGVYAMAFPGPRAFGEDDFPFFRALGQQCAQALDRAALRQVEHEALRQIGHARDRQALLPDAGGWLGAALDVDGIVDRLTRVVVPRLADWCVVDLVGDAGRVERRAVVHADPARAGIARLLAEMGPAEEGPLGSVEAARTGQAVLRPDVNVDGLSSSRPKAARLELLRGLGLASAMVVPLVARGRSLGALTLVAATSGRHFEPDDFELAQDLARRAGLALDNARLYEEQRVTARGLQVGLLPDRLPEIPGITAAARYRPFAGREIGGDFYDLFDTGRGAWGVAIGDVCGVGGGAASLAAVARHTIRALGRFGASPTEVLRALNDILLPSSAEDRFASVVYGELRVGDDGVTAHLASGGHPAPLVVSADGRVEEIVIPGSLLGIVSDPQIGSADVVAPSGSTLVLYTDGVVETRGARAPGSFGEERLRKLLETSAREGVAGIADAVMDEAVAFGGGAPRDDLALLLVRAEPSRVLNL